MRTVQIWGKIGRIGVWDTHLELSGFEDSEEEDGQGGAETRKGHVENAKGQRRWQQSLLVVGVVEQVDGAGDGQEEDQQLDRQAMAGAEQAASGRPQTHQIGQSEHAQQSKQSRRPVHLSAPRRVSAGAAVVARHSPRCRRLGATARRLHRTTRRRGGRRPCCRRCCCRRRRRCCSGRRVQQTFFFFFFFLFVFFRFFFFFIQIHQLSIFHRRRTGPRSRCRRRCRRRMPGAGSEPIGRVPSGEVDDQRRDGRPQIERLAIGSSGSGSLRIAGRVDSRRAPQSRHVRIVLAIRVRRRRWGRCPVVRQEVEHARVKLKDRLRSHWAGRAAAAAAAQCCRGRRGRRCCSCRLGRRPGRRRRIAVRLFDLIGGRFVLVLRRWARCWCRPRLVSGGKGHFTEDGAQGFIHRARPVTAGKDGKVEQR